MTGEIVARGCDGVKEEVERPHHANAGRRARPSLTLGGPGPTVLDAVERSTYADPVITPVAHFAGARDHATPIDRLRHVRRSARAFREEMLSGSKARFFKSCNLVKVPYPTKYGLRDACSLPTPYIHILNRLFIVQFETPHGVKTLLAEPLDRLGNAETPFFKRLGQPLGGADGKIPSMVWPALGEVTEILASLGIRPEDVDYITYDHLHTQDLRKWLGGNRPYFPNAKLLVTRQEWASTKGLLPTQADWYCPHGTDGVPEDRLVFLDSDVRLGDSVALIRTPGHTEGNHSIVVHTDEGLFVTSENGVAPEAYAPEHSRLPGLRKWAKMTGSEVVLNGNTLEGSVDQYISMVQEKEIAGPSARNPDFPNMACSSEMSAHWLSPGLTPTFNLGEVEFGKVVPSGAREATRAAS